MDSLKLYEYAWLVPVLPLLSAMVVGLGLNVAEVDHPFEPESGAYAQHQHDHRLSPIKTLHHVHH